MLNPSAVISDFALESLPGAPLARQAELYRAFAQLSADREQRAKFTFEAETCERMLAEQIARESRQKQLLLDFKRRARG